MYEPFTVHTPIHRLVISDTEKDLSAGLKAQNPPAFLALYDQYASVLLGVITKIIHDENEAAKLLETTFIKVHSQIDEFQPEKQPLFVWLLKIARCTALDALKQRKIIKPSAFQLTSSGKVIVANSQNNSKAILVDTPTQDANFQLNELLDKVLFENCTPEEAANSLGIPVELARQQLRVAMQQLRTSQRI